jgi:hypothetical protein
MYESCHYVVFYSPAIYLISKFRSRKFESALVFKHRQHYVLQYSEIIYQSRLIIVRIYV